MSTKPKAEKIILGYGFDSIQIQYHNAIEIAIEFKCDHVQFPFNGVNVVVSKNSPKEMTYEQLGTYQKALSTSTDVIYL